MQITHQPKGLYEKYFKRLLDLLLSLVALIAFSPLMLVVAVLVRTKLGSPILFKQQRPGKNEVIFSMYKFRTMTDEKDSEGNLLPDSMRLTGFGKFLRSTSLDELPELFNILKGDMSIVGPRPLLVRYLPFYTEQERIRHAVRPGLTGLAQVNGRNTVRWDERLGFDIEYAKNVTFYQDSLIVLKTIGKVIKRADVVNGVELVMKDLDDERK